MGDDFPDVDDRPRTYQHPHRDILGPIATGEDKLLAQLRTVHGEPRLDIPAELLKKRR